MAVESQSLTVRFGQAFRRYFVAGLATLFPLGATALVLLWIFQFADHLLGRSLGLDVPGLGLVVTILTTLVVGVFSVHFFGRVLFRTIEAWLSRLPLVRSIYPAVKQLANFLFNEEDRGSVFRRVVLVEYPRPGIFSLAFVTNETQTTATGKPQHLLTLLIPNPPSPFTGPIIFVPQEEVIPLDMSIEDTLKLIVSGGVVTAPLQAVARFKSTQHDEGHVA